MVQRCDPLDDLEPPVHAQGKHSLADRRGRNLCGTYLLHDQTAQRSCHVHGLIQTLSAFESGALTYFAALAPEERQLDDWGIERNALRVGRGKLGCTGLCISECEIAELEVSQRHLRGDFRNCELSLFRHVLLSTVCTDFRYQAL